MSLTSCTKSFFKSFATPALAVTLATGAFIVPAEKVEAVTVSQIQSQINSIIDNANSSVTWSVLIENEWGTQTYYSLNPTTPRRPASNTKIFTTAAALEIRGASYVWNGYQLGSSSDYSPVHYILNNSNNSYADSLYSNIGGGTAAINALSSAGINMSGAQMYDGSGLNYNNRFSARQTIDVIRYMMNNYTFNQWATHLTVSCVTGTLASRLCGSDTSGRVYGKTGTLTNGQTLSLSGYIDNKYDDENYYFSIYCNSVPSSFQSDTRSRMDSIVTVMGQSGIPNPGQDLGGIIVDNGTSGYSESGSWGTSSGAGYYGTSSRWASASSGTNTATWTPTISTAGKYDVYARWVASSNRTASAAYEITHIGGTAYVTGMNQKVNDATWVKLGNWSFNSGTSGKVLLDSVASLNGGDSGIVVSADAVQFVLTEAAPQPDVIVDNTSGGFSSSGSWFPGSYVSGYYGSNYHARATESTSDAATWTVTLPTSGSYTVYTRWTTGSNRATAAPYIISHSGGSTTVSTNQQQNNGQWVSLGTYNFTAGTSQRVLLSCWTSSGNFVIADAVRFVKN